MNSRCINASLFRSSSEKLDSLQHMVQLMKSVHFTGSDSRRKIFDCKWQFSTSLSHGAQLSSVPYALLCLVRMILEGPSIDVQSLSQHTPASLSIAQLVVFNSVCHKCTSVSHVTHAVRHCKEQETPWRPYVGLAVHAATRKKCLVDKLFDLRICVSYVLSVLNDIACGV